jgi:hypothetical protein
MILAAAARQSVRDNGRPRVTLAWTARKNASASLPS